ncbi:MAG: vitamin K epoxide reductase family protein [Desulfomonilaceae bacterium]
MKDAPAENRAEPFFMGRLPFFVLLIPGLIGTFATGFLTYRHIVLTSHVGAVGQSFLCRADGKIDCDSLLLTDYAILFEYFPAAVLGLMGFAFVLWCIINALVNERMRMISWGCLTVYFVAAIGFSWYFVQIMIVAVDYICTWCLVSHIMNLLSLIAVLVITFRNRQAFKLKEISTFGERFYFAFGGIAISLLIFFSSAMVEKSLSFNDAKAKYEDLANDPVVTMALVKGSPSYNIPITQSDPVFGFPEAPYPIIMFSDFQCPICPKIEATLKRLVMLNPNVLKLVFKNYPLSKECNAGVVDPANRHPMSCPAARAAYAAFLLGGSRAFGAYADLLFSNQKGLTSESWSEFVKKAGLDASKFEELMKPGSPADKKVAEDIELGVNLKLKATPQIFFEGKKIPENFKGEYFVDTLEELIRTNHPEKKDLRLKR